MQPKPKSFGEVQAANVKAAIGLEIPALPSARTAMQSRLANTWGAGDRKPWQEGECRVCGREIGLETIECLGVRVVVTNCEDCEPMVVEHYSPGAHAQSEPISMHPRWDRDCPPVFQQLCNGERPMGPIDRVAFERVRAWRPQNGRGLAISGDSGIGKTTALWSLARSLEQEGLVPIVVTSVELFRVLARSAKELADEQWLTRCGVLMIDDLGKEKVTPAGAAMLWELVERRTTHLKPIVVTTRFTGPQFVARFAEQEMGNDIRGRIAGACDHIAFKADADRRAA